MLETFSPRVLKFWFQIEVEFKIHGQGSLHADGMAIWLTKQRGQAGQVFGSVDKFEGLGIFIDTYKNNRPGVTFPYVMAMLGDGQTSYDKDHDGKANELAGCSVRTTFFVDTKVVIGSMRLTTAVQARGIRSASTPTKARVTYFQDQYLKVDLQYKELDEWIPCFELGSITLPSVAYLGFSAETGELSDNFDIISVESRNIYRSPQTDGSKKDSNSGRQKGKSYDPNKGPQSAGWGWFLLKVVLFIIVAVGGYVGFTMYRAQKRTRF